MLKLNLKINKKQKVLKKNLNTSHVKVKLMYSSINDPTQTNLNTSHVKVKQEQMKDLIKIEVKFKYISC